MRSTHLETTQLFTDACRITQRCTCALDGICLVLSFRPDTSHSLHILHQLTASSNCPAYVLLFGSVFFVRLRMSCCAAEIAIRSKMVDVAYSNVDVFTNCGSQEAPPPSPTDSGYEASVCNSRQQSGEGGSIVPETKFDFERSWSNINRRIGRW